MLNRKTVRQHVGDIRRKRKRLSAVCSILAANGGLSLVEVMMALLVLLFVSLALMQTALVSIESNMKNVLRNEAVSIAEARIDEVRGVAGNALSFDTLLSDDTPTDVNMWNNTTDCPSDFMTSFGTNGLLYKRTLKNVADFRYCTNMTVMPLSAENKQVVVTVAWLWKSEPYSHTNSTVLRRP